MDIRITFNLENGGNISVDTAAESICVATESIAQEMEGKKSVIVAGSNGVIIPVARILTVSIMSREIKH